MTVPLTMERSQRVMVMKNVKGQLLRREESYTEAFERDSFEGQPETDDDVLLHLKSVSLQEKDHTSDNDSDSTVLPPNSSVALQRNVKLWCDATGLPATISIRIHSRVFHLHKFPLVSRSGYLKMALKDVKEITLPSDVPGGPEIFELVSNFCYGSTILMEPANIAELCCIADYLQMSEDYGRANLCERSELYLTQVALQSWDDTLIVLQHCVSLAPYAEQLGIVRRCLDALAFMACMELLNPVTRHFIIPDRNGDIQSTYLHWWIEDLVSLPPSLFVNLILALRREGMQENYVGQVITTFADRWIFGMHYPASSTVLVQRGGSDKCWLKEPPPAKFEPSVLIESVVGLLPLEKNVVPTGFLFTLLQRGLTCGLKDDCRMQLETRISLQLENAVLHDLLLPGKKEIDNCHVIRSELESMERILRLFLTRFRGYEEVRPADMVILSSTAKLWDEYLAEVAFDISLSPSRFGELVETIPAHMRVVHDHMYKAIHTYLEAHPSITQEERQTVCRTLNCQKLSQETCAHAVQNDLMPLRMVVQAMFMQQLQTRSVLNSHLELATQSFRDHPSLISMHSHRHRCDLPDSTTPCYSVDNSARHHTYDTSQDSCRSLGSSFRDNDLYFDELMSAATSQNTAVKDNSFSGLPKVDFQATESRLRTLETELSRMRESLTSQTGASEQIYDSCRRAASSSHQMKAPVSDNDHHVRPKSWTQSTYSGRSGQLGTPKMATVHENGVTTGYCGAGPSGCMSQLKPVNRTTGLLGKTLQKLKLRTFGKFKSTQTVKDISAPIVQKPFEEFVALNPEYCSTSVPRNNAASVFNPDKSRNVSSRTDSMPRSTNNRVKRQHVRHNSIS